MPAIVGTVCPKVALEKLLKEVRACTVCAGSLPHVPRPVLQASVSAKILIVGQAPGRKVQESGIPFDDASGERLREWLGVSAQQFYDPSLFAILPMGFCYPGTGKSGDLPPRPECAPLWRQQLLAAMPNIQLTVIIGKYAIDWHTPELKKLNVTDAVKAGDSQQTRQIILPHPSPRNNIWLKKNPWFERDILPSLQMRVSGALAA